MKIAILGWGSLIWNPSNLEIDKRIGKNGWFDDGPALPIEFSRISQDGRLTLVIDPIGTEIITLYSISQYEELDYAILNLAVREGCGRDKIGHFRKDTNELVPFDFQFGETIKSWINIQEVVDAVIWTNLLSKLWYKDEEKNKISIERDDLISYLGKLTGHKQAIAEEYIRRTPQTIKTKLRIEIEKELLWTHIG